MQGRHAKKKAKQKVIVKSKNQYKKLLLTFAKGILICLLLLLEICLAF
jgi:hypothetical protein